MGTVLHSIAGALAATRPDAAAIIQGAAEPYFVKSPPVFTRLTISSVTAALGEERGRELRARGAGMGRDQALAYTLTQAIQALTEPDPEPQTHP
jgi:hypothetical protein